MTIFPCVMSARIQLRFFSKDSLQGGANRLCRGPADPMPLRGPLFKFDLPT
ncbi:hypothetical protein N184_22770 [Sinorhizobium sp. GL28]|nr:hypothetical protein N184_22770 [Sinorhizobium sp. GL28]